MRIKLILVFLIILFLLNTPACFADLGYLDAKHAFTTYAVSYAGFILFNFVLCFVGTKRFFSNFLLFVGLSLLVFSAYYALFMHYHVENYNLKDNPAFAFSLVSGIVVTAAGFFLHGFLDIGVAAKNDYEANKPAMKRAWRKAKRQYNSYQKKHHDPEGLR